MVVTDPCCAHGKVVATVVILTLLIVGNSNFTFVPFQGRLIHDI
jgi:hypothetical protein